MRVLYWILFLVKLGASYERLCLGALLLVVGLYFYFTRIRRPRLGPPRVADLERRLELRGADQRQLLPDGQRVLDLQSENSAQIRLAPLSVVIWFAAARTPISQLVYFVCLPYLVMILGLRVPARSNLAKTVGDLSYGVYLFAFPIQQAIVHFFGPQITATRLSLSQLRRRSRLRTYLGAPSKSAP